MSDISSTRRSVMLGSVLAAAMAEAQAAPAPAPGPGAMPNAMTATRANSGTVGVVSGGVDGTYIRIAADLAAVLDDGDRLRVLPVIGKGSVQNLSDIIFLRGIDIGIVQSDALAYVRSENMFPGIANTLKYIAKLYDEEVHILARREIRSVEDLRGKKVNLDVRGSGTAMTGSVLFGKLGIAVEPVYDSQRNALQRLLDGDIAALVYVAGKPATLFAQLRADQGLHLLPLPASPALLETYLPAQLEQASYPALVGESGPVDTLAVGAVMAVFGWPPGSERYGKVARFVEALTAGIADFQKPARHPKWKEVNLDAQVPGWTRFTVDARPPGAPRFR